MASRFDTSPTENTGRTRGPMKCRGARPSMSEKQFEAYLLAREVVRRIGRTCSLVPTPHARVPERDRTQSAHHWKPGSP